jgi:glycosyltransferase involved in cell wall biosynthesis
MQTNSTLPGIKPEATAEVKNALAGSRPLQPINLRKLPDQPLVSVLIANYSYATYIAEAIESVLNQTYPNLEVIVADDGSTDDSCSIVERYVQQDPRVKLIRRQRNGGMAATTNSAYAESRGQIICLLDSDDMYSPFKVEKVVQQLLAYPNTGLTLHRIMLVDRQHRPIQEIPLLTAFEHGWIADRVIRRGARRRDMPAGVLCFRREVAEYVFPIPEESFRRAVDGFIFTLLPLLTEVTAIEGVLYDYRIHGQNDYGSTRLTTDIVASELKFTAKQLDGVNRRLNEIGISHIHLDENQSVLFRQRQLALSLLDGTRWARVASAYTRLVPALVADDLYRPSQKLLGMLVYAGALFLPVRLRSWWLSTALAHNTIKLRLQQARKGLRYVLRLRQAHLA